MIVPAFFCIGVLVWLGLRELRKWIELLVNAANMNEDNDNNENKEEPMSDSVKHMYN
jgi:hypothetical protein